MLRALAVLLLGALLPAARGPAAAPSPAPLTVFAAASLADVLQELADGYQQAGGAPVRLSFAASSTLARQLEAGAAADLFFPADQEWMDYVEQRGLIRAPTRRNLLGNRLALIAPADSAIRLTIGPHFGLRAALHGERLATGDPDVVPAGRYARAALSSLGVWSEVADRLARADNVRSALAFVARGEVPLGIVYETDARVDRRVRIVGLFPPGSHPPISYPVALTRDAAPGAQAFIDYLGGPAARPLFERYGFTVLP